MLDIVHTLLFDARTHLQKRACRPVPADLYSVIPDPCWRGVSSSRERQPMPGSVDRCPLYDAPRGRGRVCFQLCLVQPCLPPSNEIRRQRPMARSRRGQSSPCGCCFGVCVVLSSNVRSVVEACEKLGEDVNRRSLGAVMGKV
jgi:hypothetical protein